jgi:hypothetical protein
MMATSLPPPCSMPVCLASAKMKIVAKATPAVPYEVGVVSWGYGEPRITFTASTRTFPAPMTRSMRCYLGTQRNLLVRMMLGQKQGSRIFFANRELVISTSVTRQEHKRQLMDLMGPVNVFKRALVPLSHRKIRISWSSVVQGRLHDEQSHG